MDKKNYRDTVKILRGDKELLPIFIEIKKFMSEKFGVNSLNFYYKKNDLQSPNLADKTKILGCILSSDKDYKLMLDSDYAYDKEKQALITKKFVCLAEKYKFPLNAIVSQIWVLYENFNDEYLCDIVGGVLDGLTKKKMQKKYPKADIWEVSSMFSSIVIFYKNEKIKLENEENGLSALIKNDLLEMIKKNDEFDFYNGDGIVFDTKENLEKNYAGSLFYYWR
ncbi:MAG: hypothetical protein FWC11_02835 [Firmicutes bacterium]|nr:hypothetical protein [Bacillota bacterium]